MVDERSRASRGFGDDARPDPTRDEFAEEDDGGFTAPPPERDPDDDEQPTSWDDFWQKACRKNEAAMRAAGKDPDKVEPPPKTSRGQPMMRGLPVDERYYCWGCGNPTPEADRYECCQCLEIYRDRAGRAVGDNWERAFYCGKECYEKHWEQHKERHGPSKFGPSRRDGRIHHFDAARGYGALWDKVRLKRMNFQKCPPVY